jgi:hypothetical protein
MDRQFLLSVLLGTPDTADDVMGGWTPSLFTLEWRFQYSVYMSTSITEQVWDVLQSYRGEDLIS